MKSSRRAAFTLIELIVVLAIIAVLLVVLVPRFTGYIDSARETAAKSDAAALLQAAELYVADKEVAGTAPASSISEANDTLAPYLKNLSDDASYKLTISTDSQGGYTVTGTYTKGNITVTIPEMTVTRVSSSTP